MTFAARLRTERVARGLSKRALALRAGLSPAYVTLLEQGRRIPTRTAVEALGAALLIGGTEERNALGTATPLLLEAAGYADGGQPSDSGSRPGEPAGSRSATALALLLGEAMLPESTRAEVDDVVAEVIATLHTRLRQGVPVAIAAGDVRRALANGLLKHGPEEDEVRRVLEELRSPVYDL